MTLIPLQINFPQPKGPQKRLGRRLAEIGHSSLGRLLSQMPLKPALAVRDPPSFPCILGFEEHRSCPAMPYPARHGRLLCKRRRSPCDPRRRPVCPRQRVRCTPPPPHHSETSPVLPARRPNRGPLAGVGTPAGAAGRAGGQGHWRQETQAGPEEDRWGREMAVSKAKVGTSQG